MDHGLWANNNLTTKAMDHGPWTMDHKDYGLINIIYNLKNI
jgi:hypothetical protein